MSKFGGDLVELVPAVEEVFVQMQVHCIGDHGTQSPSWTKLRYLQKLKSDVTRLRDVWSPVVGLVDTHYFDFLGTAFTVGGHSKILKLFCPHTLLLFFSHIILRLVSIIDGLLNSNSSNRHLSKPHKTAALSIILLVENRLKILVAIHDTIVLSWASLSCIKIPFDS